MYNFTYVSLPVCEKGLAEAGIDEMGVFKEFLEETIKQAFNPGLDFFKVRMLLLMFWVLDSLIAYYCKHVCHNSLLISRFS